jgi:hypothetical protein
MTLPGMSASPDRDLARALWGIAKWVGGVVRLGLYVAAQLIRWRWRG